MHSCYQFKHAWRLECFFSEIERENLDDTAVSSMRGLDVSVEFFLKNTLTSRLREAAEEVNKAHYFGRVHSSRVGNPRVFVQVYQVELLISTA